jgi:hypothetical protein
MNCGGRLRRIHMAIDWSDYKDKARKFLSDVGRQYTGVGKQEQKYYSENVECGDDAEEFILFCLQGIGLRKDQIIDEVLAGALGMPNGEAREMVTSVLPDAF